MSHISVRVFEYTSDDGTVYWSLTRHPWTVSPPKRLVLKNRRGTVLGRFLVELRVLGFALMGIKIPATAIQQQEEEEVTNGK